MKKIMFNDKYGLTQAVLEGRKTQTRRIAYDFREHTSHNVFRSVLLPTGNITYMDGKVQVLDELQNPRYIVGEEIAVAQSYEDTGVRTETVTMNGVTETFYLGDWMPGWKNKMFVRADLMPHRIRITNVRVERLQDISEDDCLKEGIYLDYSDRDWDEGDDPDVCYRCPGISEKEFGWPEKAFAYLIDKVSGKGTWQSNPWVFVYDFELVK